MTPRGIRPVVRAGREPCDLTAAELAALPQGATHGGEALAALEESLRLFAEACALPSERTRS